MRSNSSNHLLTKLSVISLSAVLIACGHTSWERDSTIAGTEGVIGDPSVPAGGNSFQYGIYAATGLGVSHLAPKTSAVVGVDVNDPDNAGGQITFGIDLTRQLSFELHSADLGSAGLTPTGRINYHVHGASALFYVGKNHTLSKRVGLTGFGRFGFGKLENSPVGDVDYEVVNGNHVLFGVGMEYATRSGFGLRAELISFEDDINYAQLALVYRLGKKRSRTQEIVAHVTPSSKDETAHVAVLPVTAVAIESTGSENSIATGSAEKCSQSNQGLLTDMNECAQFYPVSNGIKFRAGSYVLTNSALTILKNTTERLSRFPEVKVHLKAHTDSWGTTAFNQLLSEKRAESVQQYLIDKGIDIERIKTTAVGETQPIDSNATSEGRSNNRRVELIVNNN